MVSSANDSETCDFSPGRQELFIDEAIVYCTMPGGCYGCVGQQQVLMINNVQEIDNTNGMFTILIYYSFIFDIIASTIFLFEYENSLLDLLFLLNPRLGFSRATGIAAIRVPRIIKCQLFFLQILISISPMRAAVHMPASWSAAGLPVSKPIRPLLPLSCWGRPEVRLTERTRTQSSDLIIIKTLQQRLL